MFFLMLFLNFFPCSALCSLNVMIRLFPFFAVCMVGLLIVGMFVLFFGGCSGFFPADGCRHVAPRLVPWVVEPPAVLF
jgi:hypothetical protein